MWRKENMSYSAGPRQPNGRSATPSDLPVYHSGPREPNGRSATPNELPVYRSGPNLNPEHEILPGNDSEFIYAEDSVAISLAISMYSTPIHFLEGYKLLTGEGNERVRCWIKNDGSAIVGCRGTAFHSVGGLSDIIDDLHIASGGNCSLSIINEASRIISLLEGDIIVCGHSLGGQAAFCLQKKYPQIRRAISLNGAAPIIGGPFTGSGINESIFYHIVGDIISTHMDEQTCTLLRIKLPGFVDWSDPSYYHSSDRFFEIFQDYTGFTAQEEQDDITKYVYSSTLTSTFVTLVTGLVTKYLHRDRVRELVCQHPIPGSKSSGDCTHNVGLGETGVALGTFAGGFLGYIFQSEAALAVVLGGALNPFTAVPVSLGVASAVVGAYYGHKIASGEGIFDIVSFKKSKKRAK
jgi:hypothetical protein